MSLFGVVNVVLLTVCGLMICCVCLLLLYLCVVICGRFGVSFRGFVLDYADRVLLYVGLWLVIVLVFVGGLIGNYHLGLCLGLVCLGILLF